MSLIWSVLYRRFHCSSSSPVFTTWEYEFSEFTKLFSIVDFAKKAHRLVRGRELCNRFKLDNDLFVVYSCRN